MEATMSATLDTIGSLLTRQHRQLPLANHLSEQEYTLTVDETTLKVKVIMEREVLPRPKNAIVFTGKTYADMAWVKCPANETIVQVFENYFKRQVLTGGSDRMANVNVYRFVKINDKKISLEPFYK